MNLNRNDLVEYKEYRLNFKGELELVQKMVGRIAEVFPSNSTINRETLNNYAYRELPDEYISKIAYSAFDRVIIMTKEQTEVERARYELLTLIPDCMRAGTQSIKVIDAPILTNANIVRDY